MKSLTPEKLQNWTGRFIDVRNLDEFACERMDKAQCVPLDRLLTEAGPWNPKDPILLMCKSGMRSGEAARRLEGVGFSDVWTLDGGIEACKRAKTPGVIVERAHLPLQRQVLMAAGIVLLSGLILSHLHPLFIAIDWFAATMLVIAGLTGFCPMAGVLKRMPWNAEPKCTGKTCC